MDPSKLKYVDRTLDTASQIIHALLPIAYVGNDSGIAYQALDQLALKYLRSAYADIWAALSDNVDELSLSPSSSNKKVQAGVFQVPSSLADFLVEFDKMITEVKLAVTSMHFYEARENRRMHAILSLELAAEHLEHFIVKRLTQPVPK